MQTFYINKFGKLDKDLIQHITTYEVQAMGHTEALENAKQIDREQSLTNFREIFWYIDSK